MLTLTIDGQIIKVPQGTMLMEACQKAGADIPFFCYDPDLSLTGGCRICVVESKTRYNLLASCVTPAEDGMEVMTESPRVIEARKVNLELLLARHRLECHTCERDGDCRLQDYCYRYGVTNTRFSGEAIDFGREDPNPFIKRDYNKGIMCTRCVRACSEITCAHALNISERAYLSEIIAGLNGDLADSTCVFCGQCVMVCPVGALTNKPSAGKGKSYQTEKARTICGYCGVGCTIELSVRNNKVVGVNSIREEQLSPANKGALCVKGRYGWDFINSPDRLTTPLIKDNSTFKQTSWEDALSYAAKKISEIKEKHGSDALAVLSSSRTSNEENYIAQKFARAVLGTNNVDNCARL